MTHTIQKEIFNNIMVSFYDNIKRVKRLDLPINRIFNGIRSCAYGNIVENARNYLNRGDVAEYNKIKENLPAVTFCGTFNSSHKADDCNRYNNLLVIDIDKLDDDELLRIHEVLENEPHIAAFWLSPSGRGYKGLVHLEYTKETDEYNFKDKHNIAFKQLFVYLLAHYNIELDKSGSDISRLCFMSADEKIRIKNEAEPFIVRLSSEIAVNKREKAITVINVEMKNWNEIYGKATHYTNNKLYKNELLYIYRKLKKRGLSITDSWENWVKVAFSIASTIHPEKGRELFLNFCRLDGVKHDEGKSEHLIWDAYCKNQGKCSISTIIYLAKQKGVVLDR